VRLFRFILLNAVALLLCGCTGMDRYDRNYSVSYEDATGRKISTGVTLHPRDGKQALPFLAK